MIGPVETRWTRVAALGALVASLVAACGRGTPPAPPPPPLVRAGDAVRPGALANIPPALSVSGNAPTGEATYGAVVDLAAECNDREDGALRDLRWTTGDGRVLGEGPTLRVMPEPGRHQLFVTCTDRGGRSTTVAAGPPFEVVDRWHARDSIPVIVTLPFATSRARQPGTSSVGGEFDARQGASLSRGVLSVNLPSRYFRRAGTARRTPFMRSQRGNFSADDAARLFVREGRALDSAALAALLHERAASDVGGDLLVFVHGFNTSFAMAVERATRLVGELQYPGAVVLYSWPSAAQVGSYRRDQDEARGSGRSLAGLLVELQRAAPLRRVSVVGHSMGGEVLAAALRHLDSSGTELALGNVVLVAPDLSADDFLDHVLPSLRARAALVTVYASSADFALWSSWGSNRARRLGLGGRFATLARDVETIEVPFEASDRFGHSPFLAETFRDDLHALLVGQLPAERRGLVVLPRADGKVMWRLP